MLASLLMRTRITRWLARLGLGLLGLLLVALGLLLMLEWRPDDRMPTPVAPGHEAPAEPPAAGAELSLLSWNLGYAGLDRGADFFMDGGAQVRPRSRGRVERNLRQLAVWLAAHPAAVVLLQEVDFDAARSFGMDQARVIAAALPAHFRARALNFRVAYIPYPLRRPLGKVHSGLLSLSRPRPSGALRLQLPGDYAWPVRVFHLKRCIHQLRLAAPDGHDWVLLHLHLSAFDRDGRLRAAQMAFLKQHMLRLAAAGHHVVVGGDWNHAPPGLAPDQFGPAGRRPDWFQQVPAGWTPPGWRWAWDADTPSLRATDAPYRPGETFTTTVDAFLLGPDVELLAVECADLGFAHSDHNPVLARVRLR